MPHLTRRTHRLEIAAFALLASAFAPALRGQWTAPTPQELSLTSIPEVPGATAEYLYKEQTTDDALHMFSFYVRLKVLSEGGLDNANVELPYYTGEGGTTIDNIAGRTIHPDGTIIPFTGKPYDKLIVKAGDYQKKAKVFTLPSVTVGSIIEYRYKIRLADEYYESPDWYIQSDLFVRKGHYMWRPTSRDLYNEKGEIVSGRIAWAPILPPGTELQQPKQANGNLELDLDVHDIPPLPHEEFMPPMQSISYRVLFYYTPYQNASEFWKGRGKEWEKMQDKFIGPNSPVKDLAGSLVSPSDTPLQKADKIYAAVMTMENTDFTRERTTREEKAAGLKEVKDTGDLAKRKRGSGDQLAELYVALARAAGLKAYLAGVADRSQHLFVPMYLSLRQIDDFIAIVNIDGKDVYYDPGTRFCEAGHLAWRHTLAGGIRQTDSGAELFTTPSESYKFSVRKRIADLTLDEHGVASGNVTVSYTGDPALRWRHEALKGDDTSLNTDLRTMMEESLPGGMEVRVTNVDNLGDYTKPLTITYSVKGAVGSSTGKRLLVPADLFEANAKPLFTEPKREVLVDMHYASFDQDAVRFKFPNGLAVESSPTPEKTFMAKTAYFETFSKSTPQSFTTFRNVTVALPVFTAKEYPDLREFYGKLETKDQETLILTHSVASTTPAVAPSTPTASVSTKPSGN